MPAKRDCPRLELLPGSLHRRAQPLPATPQRVPGPPSHHAPVAPDPRASDPCEQRFLPRHEEVVGAPKPSDLHQRRLGQNENARHQRRAGELGADYDDRGGHEVAGRQQVHAYELGRDHDHARDAECDQRAIRRQAGDPKLGHRPDAKARELGQQIGERAPAPFLEQEQERQENVEPKDDRRPDQRPPGAQQTRQQHQRGTEPAREPPHLLHQPGLELRPHRDRPFAPRLERARPKVTPAPSRRG